MTHALAEPVCASGPAAPASTPKTAADPAACCPCPWKEMAVPDSQCPNGWPVDPDTGLADGPCGHIGCCSMPVDAEQQAAAAAERAHLDQLRRLYGGGS